MSEFNIEKCLSRIQEVKGILHDILQGEKPFLKGDNDFIKGQLQKAYEVGALGEPAYKYLKNSSNDKTSERFITHEWGTSAFAHKSLKTFFVGLKRELGKDRLGNQNYRNFGITTPHHISENSNSEIEYKSAVYIPSGGIKSMLLYLDTVEKKLSGQLSDTPVFVHDVNGNGNSYFNGLNSAIGLTVNLKSLDVKRFYSSSNVEQLVEKFAKLSSKDAIKHSTWINYKEDFYKKLPEGQPPVFVLNTGNTEKIEEFKRCLKHFGVTAYAFKADDVFGAISSPEERSESFAGNNTEKREPLIKALNTPENNEKLQDFLKKYEFRKEQIFFGVHDGGLAFDERIYKHAGFSKISDLCKLAGINVDPVNTKQMVEYAGNVYNLFKLINEIAHKEGNPELLRAWELDNFSFFNAAKPEQVFNYNSRKENLITLPEKLTPEIDARKSSFFMRIPGEDKTQAENGRGSHINGYTKAEDAYLATNTGFGDAVWLVVNALNFTFNKNLPQINKAGIIDVAIVGESSDQKKSFLTKNLISSLGEIETISLNEKNLKRKLVKKPDEATSFQEKILRENDAFIFLPMKKLSANESLNEEETRKNLTNLAKSLFTISALYVDKMDLQTPFGQKKLAVLYMPEGMEKDYSFDYVERIFFANADNFGGKGNPNQFWVKAKSTEDIERLVKEHCETYTKPTLPEKREYLIPELSNLGTPCVTVFGSSSTENPEIWKASRDLYAGLLESGISISYGGMVRGVGKGLVADIHADNMVGALNDEVLLKRIENKVARGEINKPSIIGVYTNESKDKEGALFAHEFPKAANAVNIIAVKSENIYHRMDIMDDVAVKNKVTPDFGSISIITPGSNGTLEELAKNLIEGFKNPGSREVVVWNYKNDFGSHGGDNIGYYDEVLKTLRDAAGLKDNKSLEKYGIYVEETTKGVLNKVDALAKQALDNANGKAQAAIYTELSDDGKAASNSKSGRG